MPSLKGRLSRLKDLGLIKASEIGVGGKGADAQSHGDLRLNSGMPARPGSKERTQEEKAFLPGWDRIAAHTFSRTVETGFSLPERGGEAFDGAYFGKLRPFAAGKHRAVRDAPDAVPDATTTARDNNEAAGATSFRQLSFFDLETTGLSGGTGTLAFLAAFGFFEGDEFLVTQVFIDDFPGERAFLDFAVELLLRRPFLVTYNGKAFDVPLLRTRCVLNGVVLPEFGHIDALHTARRFWKRALDSCSLSSMELNILGVERENDVPSFLIPRLWLDFASCPPEDDARGLHLKKMEGIIDHNAQDVVSLARLFVKINRIYAEPLHCRDSERVDRSYLARALIARGREEEGILVLEGAGADGDQRALRLLARIYRRFGRIDDYARIVASMDEMSVEGCIEKAKFHEHVKRNAGTALIYTDRALSLLGGAVRASQDPLSYGDDMGERRELFRKRAAQRRLEDALKKRRARLEVKLDSFR